MNLNQRMSDLEHRIASPRRKAVTTASSPTAEDHAAFAKAFDEFVALHPVDQSALREFNTGIASMKASNR